MARARFDEVATAIGDDKKQKEQCYGIKHDPLGVQWCPSLWPLIDYPNCIYYDWMHCWCASGGIGQYSLNQICRRISQCIGMSDDGVREEGEAAK